MSVNEKMIAIADRLRGYTQGEEKLTLDEMAVAIDVAFSQGVSAGMELGDNYNQDMGDDFWNIYQANGKRTDYSNAFGRNMFTDNSLKPKYKLNVTNAYRMFDTNGVITDLSIIDMDFSRCTNFDFAFNGMSALVKFGDISTVSADRLYRPFVGCTALIEVGEFTTKEETTFNNVFGRCESLEKVTFKGVIGQDFTVQHSPLNRASIESLVRCLSADAEGKTLTLKSGIVNTAFETSTGAGDGESAFLAFIDELGKDNWSIVY